MIVLLTVVLAALSGCSALVPEAAVPPAEQAALGPTAAPPPTLAPTITPLPTPTQQPTVIPLGPTLQPTAVLPALGREERLAVFTQVWETVRDQYVYTDYRGQDWNAVRAEIEPQVAAAPSPEAFYALMEALIERLGDDHSRFASPQQVAADEARFNGTLEYGGIGALVRTVSEGGLITSLAKDGPAAQAGLQPRDVILKVGTLPFTDTEAFGLLGPVGVIQGVPGTILTLTVRTQLGPPREVQLRRAVIPSDAFPDVETLRVADGRVGLLRLNTFYAEGIDSRVRDAVEQLVAEGPLDGLIIDLRENGGGRVDLMLQTVGLFVDGGLLGRSVSRTSSAALTIPGGRVIEALREVPIVLLTGPDTVSAAEMFAGGMQALGRARVVGMPSAGNTESMRPHELLDGSRLWLAELSFELPDGRTVEGSGVRPDRAIETAWWRFALQDDPQVLAAVEEVGE